MPSAHWFKVLWTNFFRIPIFRAMNTADDIARIEAWRRANKLTRHQLAETMGLNPTTYENWTSRGRLSPDKHAQTFLAIIAREPDLIARIVHNMETT